GPGLDSLIAARETLVDLDLSETLISNEGVSHIPQFKNLKVLNLWNGSLDDDGVALLGDLTQLTNLSLQSCTAVTSASADTLAKLTNLESLNLSETGFDDEGLAKLEGLKKLKTLDLSRTDVSDEAVKEFEKTHPGCT